MSENESNQKEQQGVVQDEVELQSDVASQTDASSNSVNEPEIEPTSVDAASELEAAQAEIAKLKDAFLRAKAEEDNVRRRTEKEVANSRKFAIEGFAKEMMNVRDSLKLACDSRANEDSDDTAESIHQGVEITLKQLDAAFAKFAVVEILPETGDKLDPNLHQAMSLVESDEVESGKIITVIQSGYQLHDRLLRPALVVVAK